MRLPIYLKKLVFRDLYTKVLPFALKEILSYYLKVINYEIKPYIKFFTTTMELPCSYIIE